MARDSAGIGVETKVAAGSSTTIAAGYIAWALITFVPYFKNNVPSDVQGQLPVVIAFVLSSIAAWYAPHTHRPDLAPVTPPEPPKS